MKLSHRKQQFLSRLLLAVVLFAQGILAAHACVKPLASAALAVAGADEAMESMPCCPHETRVSSNECLMHCTQADQVNLDQHDMAAIAINEGVLRVVLPVVQYRQKVPLQAPVALNTGPPLPIRYCSFLL